MISTEIIWALKVAMSVYSNNSCDDITEAFRVISPDSKITEDFKVGKIKTMYVIKALLHILNLSSLKKSKSYWYTVPDLIKAPVKFPKIMKWRCSFDSAFMMQIEVLFITLIFPFSDILKPSISLKNLVISQVCWTQWDCIEHLWMARGLIWSLWKI